MGEGGKSTKLNDGIKRFPRVRLSDFEIRITTVSGAIYFLGFTLTWEFLISRVEIIQGAKLTKLKPFRGYQKPSISFSGCILFNGLKIFSLIIPPAAGLVSF